MNPQNPPNSGKTNRPVKTEPSTRSMALAIQSVRCPRCEFQFERNCEGLDLIIQCPACSLEFAYVDGYLNNYKAFIEIFIDDVHPIPLVPGYSIGGKITIPPGEMKVVPFGIEYVRRPEVFFLNPGGEAAKELNPTNLLLFPLSVSTSNAVFFCHRIDPGAPASPVDVMWMAIGETEDWEKPLWLNYLQNSADLVRKGEDIAAVVMLLIALDFYYDYILKRFGIKYERIRKLGRRPGMNEKRAKLKLIAERMGEMPASFGERLRDLTDYRNSIVHGIVKRPDVPEFTGRRAFQVVMRAVMFMIEMYYRPPMENESDTLSNHE